jgi:hypothetical protein
MVQRTIPRLAFVLLFTGGALVWAWELALLFFGARPATWSIIAVASALIFLSYFVLIWRERH